MPQMGLNEISFTYTNFYANVNGMFYEIFNMNQTEYMMNT